MSDLETSIAPSESSASTERTNSELFKPWGRHHGGAQVAELRANGQQSHR